MAELKTKKNDASVDAFIAGVADKTRREDAQTLVEFLRKTTTVEPKMWGTAIIGFGSCHLKYESGRELDWFPVGFSPRKANTVMYFHRKYAKYESDLARLGKHKGGKGCLYINKLEDIDLKILKTIVEATMKVNKS